MIDFLTGHGVTRVGAIKLASSGKGWWRLTDATQVKQAMSIAWFTALGLTSMADHHAALNLAGNRRGTDPYARWCEVNSPAISKSTDSCGPPWSSALLRVKRQ